MATKKKTPKKKTPKKTPKTEPKAELVNVTKGGRRRRPDGMDPVEFRLRELERRVSELEA